MRLWLQWLPADALTEGIDAGGLFKELWTDLSRAAFHPDYGLFRLTGDGVLFPSSSSRASHGEAHLELFEFLGRVLGKALFEGIVVEPKFAHFFLSFMGGAYNYLHMLADLE